MSFGFDGFGLKRRVEDVIGDEFNGCGRLVLECQDSGSVHVEGIG